MKLAQYNQYLVRTVDADGLVFHQDISSHGASNTPAVYGLNLLLTLDVVNLKKKGIKLFAFFITSRH